MILLMIFFFVLSCNWTMRIWKRNFTKIDKTIFLKELGRIHKDAWMEVAKNHYLEAKELQFTALAYRQVPVFAATNRLLSLHCVSLLWHSSRENVFLTVTNLSSSSYVLNPQRHQEPACLHSKMLKFCQYR